MKTLILWLFVLNFLMPVCWSQTEKPAVGASKPTLAELEKIFINTLTKATLSGHWSMIQDGQLSSEKTDKYTITSVMKLAVDAWLIHARGPSGAKKIAAPIPVQVEMPR